MCLVLISFLKVVIASGFLWALGWSNNLQHRLQGEGFLGKALKKREIKLKAVVHYFFLMRELTHHYAWLQRRGCSYSVFQQTWRVQVPRDPYFSLSPWIVAWWIGKSPVVESVGAAGAAACSSRQSSSQRKPEAQLKRTGNLVLRDSR